MKRCLVIVVTLLMSGCSLLPQRTIPVEAPPEPPPAPVSDIVILPPPPKPNVPAPVKVPLPPPLPPVAILLSSKQPAYSDVARELAQRFENHQVYDLSAGDQVPVSVIRLINDSDSGTVIAIGLRAAQSAVASATKPVVFSQVFNYREHGLLTENSRGVAALVPPDAQLAAWLKFDPSLSRIGAILGPGHDDLESEARLAAEQHGIELRMHVTRSDQETLYFYKRMVRDIDGFWLFPDNRVLSRRALQVIMEDAQRENVSVLVPSDSMLQMGADISVSSVTTNIADTITKVVQQIQAGNLEQVPPITALSETQVETAEATQVVDR